MINKTHFTAEHRSTLKQCIKTEKPIQKFIADNLIKTEIYEFYCHDKRINADRYILRRHHLNIGLPTWLHIYKKPKHVK